MALDSVVDGSGESLELQLAPDQRQPVVERDRQRSCLAKIDAARAAALSSSRWPPRGRPSAVSAGRPTVRSPRSSTSSRAGSATAPTHWPIRCTGSSSGIHKSGKRLDPDDQPGPDPDLIERMQEAVASYFASADPEPAAVDTCLYTNTEDERFILERHGRIVVGSACSGHGFKFAPVVGERLAELALTQP